MSTTTTNLFSHETVNQLVVEPLFKASVALSTLKILQTSASVYYLPKTGIGTADFTAELDPITDADVDSEMLEVRPKKVASVQIVSNESADDANAAQIMGLAVVAGLADKVDEAFFAGASPTGPEGLPGIDFESVLDDPTTGLDPFVDAIAAIEEAGGVAGQIYMRPSNWATLSKLKVTDESQQPVLSPQGGLSEAQPRSLFGVPVSVSRHVSEGQAWVVDTTRTVAVVRTPFSLAVDKSVKFMNDGTAVRAVGRVEFESIYSETVVLITPGS